MTDVKKLAVSVNGACEILGCGVTTLYSLMGDGEIDHFKIGRATRIPVTSLEEYIRRRVEIARAVGFTKPKRLAHTADLT